MKSWPNFSRRFAWVLLWTSGVSGTHARAEETFYTQRVAPILDKNCVVCHGPKKQKGDLRLDSFAELMKGGKNGVVVKARDPKDSELYVRVTMHPEDEDFMPADSKPPLKPAEIKVLELWIVAGADDRTPASAVKGVPALAAPKPPTPALTADWQPRRAEIAALEKSLGLRLVPRSRLGTDGLVLRTASVPGRCDDAALAKLAPVADLIVEAELARTKVTDAGLATLATFTQLRILDLTRTSVTSGGVVKLVSLKQLESLNLTATAVDEAGIAPLKSLPVLKQTWLFGTKVPAAAPAP